jgi:hypothetical protein
MILVPANIVFFGFSPYKYFCLVLVPANLKIDGFGPWWHMWPNIIMACGATLSNKVTSGTKNNCFSF